MVSKLTKKNIKRIDNRNSSELRDVKITPNYLPDSEGSALIEVGNTKVICSATIEKKVPRWLKGKGSGWVTAEYSMLPRSSKDRIQRERFKVSGRTQEIQRLIGRSLRSVVNLKKMAEYQIKIDCDVIQADGGTRTAAITGGWVALYQAINFLLKTGKLTENPITDQVAAISCGICENQELLDLDYEEDSNAETDGNFVMTASSGIVEIQTTAEEKPINKEQFQRLLSLAELGMKYIFKVQKNTLGLS